MKKQSRLYKQVGVISLRRLFAGTAYFALAIFAIIKGNPVINLAVIVLTAIILADLIKLHASLSVRISAGNNMFFEGIAGRKIYIPVTYRNYTPFCYPVCRFCVYDARKTETDSPVFSIEPFRKQTVCVEINPQYCGIYAVELNKITVWDSFGFFCMKKRTKASTCSLTVLPEIITDRFPGLPKDDKPEDEDYQFRNYEDGDNLRLVNWKKSAGSEELIVKQITEKRNPYDILLYYNSAPVSDTAFIDTLASCAATVAELIKCRRKDVLLYYTNPSSGITGPFGKDDGITGIMRAISAAGFCEGLPETPPEAEGADSVYIVTPEIPQDVGSIVNNPLMRDKNVYVFSLIDDSKNFVIPENYRYVIPLRYTLLRRGGAKNE